MVRRTCTTVRRAFSCWSSRSPSVFLLSWQPSRVWPTTHRTRGRTSSTRLSTRKVTSPMSRSSDKHSPTLSSWSVSSSLWRCSLCFYTNVGTLVWKYFYTHPSKVFLAYQSIFFHDLALIWVDGVYSVISLQNYAKKSGFCWSICLGEGGLTCLGRNVSG